MSTLDKLHNAQAVAQNEIDQRVDEFRLGIVEVLDQWNGVTGPRHVIKIDNEEAELVPGKLPPELEPVMAQWRQALTEAQARRDAILLDWYREMDRKPDCDIPRPRALDEAWRLCEYIVAQMVRVEQFRLGPTVVLKRSPP
jgi:hypothetical protein